MLSLSFLSRRHLFLFSTLTVSSDPFPLAVSSGFVSSVRPPPVALRSSWTTIVIVLPEPIAAQTHLQELSRGTSLCFVQKSASLVEMVPSTATWRFASGQILFSISKTLSRFFPGGSLSLRGKVYNSVVDRNLRFRYGVEPPVCESYHALTKQKMLMKHSYVSPLKPYFSMVESSHP